MPSEDDKPRKSRRRFLLGVAGLGLAAYLLYQFYPDILTLIPSKVEDTEPSKPSDGDVGVGDGGDDIVKPPEETPVYEGVVAPEPPPELATPYLRVSKEFGDFNIIDDEVYIKVVNEGRGPAYSGVLEVYKVDKLRGIFPDEEWLNGKWVEDAILLGRKEFIVNPRRHLNIYFRVGEFLDRVAYSYVFVVYDEAFDPRDLRLSDENRKLVKV